MRVLITGATGMLGSALADALLARGDTVVGTSRNPDRAETGRRDIEWHGWDPASEPAPAAALAGCDAVVNLMGEEIDQRWNKDVKRRIRESRVEGSRNLVAGLAAADPRPPVLVAQSAVGYYGDRGDEVLGEEALPGPESDFLVEVVVEWEAESNKALDLDMRVATTRTGLVLTPAGGLLKRLLLPFKLGVGGPIASGKQYMSWIHIEDEIGLILWAIETESATGPLNFTAPEPVTNREFSKALGRALRRPAVMPVPKPALRVVLGEVAKYATESQRAVPARALDLGYRFRHAEIEPALRDLVG